MFNPPPISFHRLRSRKWQGAEVTGTIECEAARVNGKFDGVFVSSHSLHVSIALSALSICLLFVLSVCLSVYLSPSWFVVVHFSSCRSLPRRLPLPSSFAVIGIWRSTSHVRLARVIKHLKRSHATTPPFNTILPPLLLPAKPAALSTVFFFCSACIPRERIRANRLPPVEGRKGRSALRILGVPFASALQEIIVFVLHIFRGGLSVGVGVGEEGGGGGREA